MMSYHDCIIKTEYIYLRKTSRICLCMVYPSIKHKNSSTTRFCGIEEVSRVFGNLIHAELHVLRTTDMKKLGI